MNETTCLYCNENKADSNEHLIVDRRIKRINSFKTDQEKNDNIQKDFKKITCEPCNNRLGEYEEKSTWNLAYATIWKIIAGNINKAFNRLPEYYFGITSDKTIKFYENLLLNVVKKELILPKNTFDFDFNPMNSSLSNKFGFATKKILINPVNEKGEPIEGAKIYTKDKSGSGTENGYIATSDKNGKAELKILTAIEKIRVVKETIKINNSNDLNSKEKNIEFESIVYLSFNANGNRLICILPLLHSVSTDWGDIIIELFDENFFLKTINKAFPEMEIVTIRKFFKENYPAPASL